MVLVQNLLQLFARLAGAEYGIWSVSREVNGPLMMAVAKRIGYHDLGAIEMLRKGGPLVGLLPCSGKQCSCTPAGGSSRVLRLQEMGRPLIQC